MELERRPAKIVRAALDLDVDGGSTREPLLGVEAARHDVDGLQRFERRDVRRHVRQPDVGGAHAVDPDVVGAAAGAVDVEHQRARRIGGHRVCLSRRREAWQHAEQVLIVPVHRHRQVHQLPRLQLRAHLGAFGLQERTLGRYRHRFAELTNLQRRVNARHVVQRHQDIRTGERPEPGELDGHRICARLHGWETVSAGGVGDDVARRAGLTMRNRDHRSRNRRTGLVGDVADERAVQHLGVDR